MVRARARARRQPRRSAPARAARLRAVAAVAAPTSPRGDAPFGAGRPGLAHRVLGDGDARARPDPRSARRRHRPDLPAPRVRDRAERVAHRASRSSRHWMHSAMVSYEGEKMSKSLGNLVFVSDLLKVADPRAIRLALMRHHYRSGFEWYDTDIDEGDRAAAPAARRGRAAPTAPIPRRSRSVCAPRSTTTSTRRARSRRSTTSPSAILSGGAATRPRPIVLRELGQLARRRPQPSPRPTTPDAARTSARTAVGAARWYRRAA